MKNRIKALLVALCLLSGICLGVGGYTFYYARGASYLSNDPKACVNCHVMREQYDGWERSSHHDVATCNDCHVPHDTIGKYLSKMKNGYHHSRAFTMQDYPEAIQIKPGNLAILQKNCLHCHETMAGDIAGRDAPDCVRCHAGVGHASGK